MSSNETQTAAGSNDSSVEAAGPALEKRLTLVGGTLSKGKD